MQKRAVEVLLNEWVAARVVGRDPFDIEDVVGGMVRDQYQGGATVMTAISGAERLVPPATIQFWGPKSG